MRVAPLSEALGAELPDFDLHQSCTPEQQAELRRLFCEYHLLAVRGHDEVTEDDQTRFVGYFGPVHLRADGKNETFVSNTGGRGVGTGQSRLLWHQDGTYGVRPGIATSLCARDVSPDAVPTLFANAVRALERLPDDLSARVRTLHAVHGKDTQIERTDIRYREEETSDGEPQGRFARYEHPVVYRMPHSGRDTILVSEFFTSHIVEMARHEGEALLQLLFSRMYSDDNVYAHRWQAGDLIIWDNMALQHCRPADMGTAARRLRRQSIDGWFSDDGLLEWPETVIAYAATN